MYFLGLIVVLAALVFALGYYLGWFKLSSLSTTGESEVTLTVNKDKMNHDKQTAQRKVQDLGHQAKEAVSTSAPATGNERARAR